MPVDNAIKRLYGRRRFGIKPGLDVAQALLTALGSPEQTTRFVHVAGTNGKGSVCAMLASILHASGLNVGLYTSPHLVRFNERFQVNGHAIDDDELLELMVRIEAVAEDVGRTIGQEPTFFECSTAIAFEYFRRHAVDCVVLETGLGGRLDATNTVQPLLSVITRIGVEHTVYLGNSLAEIAAEKAGIVKAGVPVVAGGMPAEALDVIRRTAARHGCRIVTAADHASIRVKSVDWSGQVVHAETAVESYGTLRVPLPGVCQVENLATALSAVDVLRDTVPLPMDVRSVRKGLERVQWPGRFQLLRPVPPLVLDGAHNPDAGRALAETLSGIAAGAPLGLIVGMCSDKDARGFLHPFSKKVQRLWVVPVRDERSMSVDAMLGIGRDLGFACEGMGLQAALRAARTWAGTEGGAICVTGSLYLVGELLEDLPQLVDPW